MRLSLPLLALAGALALAGCGRSGSDAEPEANNATEAPIVEEPVNIPVINEVEEEEEVNTVDVVPPPAPPPVVSDDEQMREDADATGLTTRLPDDDGGETPPPPGEGRNDSAPNP